MGKKEGEETRGEKERKTLISYHIIASHLSSPALSLLLSAVSCLCAVCCAVPNNSRLDYSLRLCVCFLLDPLNTRIYRRHDENVAIDQVRSGQVYGFAFLEPELEDGIQLK